MRYWSVVDTERPDPLEPWSVFRADRVEPPFELYDPATGAWVDEPALVACFTGDDLPAVPLEEGDVPAVLAVLDARFEAEQAPAA